MKKLMAEEENKNQSSMGEEKSKKSMTKEEKKEKKAASYSWATGRVHPCTSPAAAATATVPEDGR